MPSEAECQFTRQLAAIFAIDPYGAFHTLRDQLQRDKAIFFDQCVYFSLSARNEMSCLIRFSYTKVFVFSVQAPFGKGL